MNYDVIISTREIVAKSRNRFDSKNMRFSIYIAEGIITSRWI